MMSGYHLVIQSNSCSLLKQVLKSKWCIKKLKPKLKCLLNFLT